MFVLPFHFCPAIKGLWVNFKILNIYVKQGTMENAESLERIGTSDLLILR